MPAPHIRMLNGGENGITRGGDRLQYTRKYNIRFYPFRIRLHFRHPQNDDHTCIYRSIDIPEYSRSYRFLEVPIVPEISMRLITHNH